MPPTNGAHVAIQILLLPLPDGSGVQVQVSHAVDQGWPAVESILLEALRIAIRQQFQVARPQPLIEVPRLRLPDPPV